MAHAVLGVCGSIPYLWIMVQIISSRMRFIRYIRNSCKRQETAKTITTNSTELTMTYTSPAMSIISTNSNNHDHDDDDDDQRVLMFAWFCLVFSVSLNMFEPEKDRLKLQSTTFDSCITHHKFIFSVMACASYHQN